MTKRKKTKGVIRSRKSKTDWQCNGQKKKDWQYNGQKKKDWQYNGQKKKDWQYNGQKKKNKWTNNDTPNTSRATRTPLKTGVN